MFQSATKAPLFVLKEQELQKFSSALAQSESEPKPNEKALLSSNSEMRVSVSGVDIEQSLLKQILPENYHQALADKDLREIHKSYIYRADQQIKQASDSEQKLQSITQGLLHNIHDSHNQVKTMFEHLGQMTKSNADILIKSEAYLFDKVSTLANIAAKDFKPHALPLLPHFEFSVQTQEGDTVKVKYNHQFANHSDMSFHSASIDMDIEGDLSKEEQGALQALFKQVGQFVEQTMNSVNGQSLVEGFDFNEGFDANLLSGFSVETGGGGSSSLEYQIDKENNQQHLQADLYIRGTLSASKFEITTALNGDQSGKDKVLNDLATMLEQVKAGGTFNSGMSEYILQSFDSMLSTDRTKHLVSSDEQELRQKLNQHIEKRDLQAGEVGLKQLSEVADYRFSLTLIEGSLNRGHETKVKMAQQTEIGVDASGFKVKQKQSKNIDSLQEKYSMDRRKTESVRWKLDEEQQLEASFRPDHELSKHQVSGHRRQSIVRSGYTMDFKKKFDKQISEQNYKQVLEVLGDLAKLSKEQNETQETGSYRRVKDMPVETVSESRFSREYKKIQMLKLKDL